MSAALALPPKLDTSAWTPADALRVRARINAGELDLAAGLLAAGGYPNLAADLRESAKQTLDALKRMDERR